MTESSDGGEKLERLNTRRDARVEDECRVRGGKYVIKAHAASVLERISEELGVGRLYCDGRLECVNASSTPFTFRKSRSPVGEFFGEEQRREHISRIIHGHVHSAAS
jgi:hypothetical protein